MDPDIKLLWTIAVIGWITLIVVAGLAWLLE